MTTAATSARPGAALGYAAVLARAEGKARVNLNQHTDALDALALPGRAATWRGLVAMLGGLADHDLRTVGHGAVQFFVADGRYRLQLFALEDCNGGRLHVFLPDVLEQALARRLIVGTAVAGHYAATDDPATVLAVELLDGSGTTAPAQHFKFMVGLSRRALRLTLAADGDPGQMRVTRALCELAASLNVPATSLPWVRGQPMPRRVSQTAGGPGTAAGPYTPA